MSSPRKSLVAAILAALPRGVDDGAVSVVHAGELVTVTLTLPGATRPLVTATVRRPAPASDAERQLAIPAAAVPARRPSVPPSAEAPATTAATATNDEPRLVAPIVVPPIAPPGRVLRVGDAVFEGDLTWVVELVDVERSLVTLSCNGRTQTVDRTHITLDSADLWRHPAADVSTSPLTVAEERALAADAAALPETRAAAPTEIFSVEIAWRAITGPRGAEWWVCGPIAHNSARFEDIVATLSRRDGWRAARMLVIRKLLIVDTRTGAEVGTAAPPVPALPDDGAEADNDTSSDARAA